MRYEYVYRLKKERPDLTITINGGITTLEECREHLRHVDGVMLGREAYHNPFLLSGVDSQLCGAPDRGMTREQFLDDIEPYILEELERGTPLHAMVKHILGLYAGQPGARKFRQVLSEESVLPGAGIEVLHKARRVLRDTALQVLEFQSR